MRFQNEIVNGDCTHVLPQIPSECVDFVLTDPPYGVSYRDRAGRTIANDTALEPILAAFPELFRILKPDTFCVCFYGWNRIDTFYRAWRRAGFAAVGHIVFHKPYASRRGFLEARHEQAYLLVKGRPRKPAVPLADVRSWEYSGNRVHPTEKAVSILKPLIECFSPRDGLVADAFCGSGSTAVAAAECGRRFIGIELETRYCEHARARLARFRASPDSPHRLSDALTEFDAWMRTRGAALPPGFLVRTMQSIAGQ